MKKSILAFLLTLSFSVVSAQQNPVRWDFGFSHIKENIFELTFTANISAPWHLYDLGPYTDGPFPTAFTFTPTTGVEFVGTPYPKTSATEVDDPVFLMKIGYFGNTAVFGQKVRLTEKSATIKGIVEWMVCNDQSCLPPTDKDFQIKITNPQQVVVVPQVVVQDSIPTQSTVVAPPQIAKTAPPAKSLWATVVEAILWGFVALLTPCVFPMVPMTVSFFLKGQQTPARGRFLAMMYGFFIVALYTIPIAVIILVTRIVGGDAVTADIFNWLATHWIPNVIFFLVFMVFAASFFGAFEITLPSWLVNSSNTKSEGGGLGGLFFMAVTLVLVSFSCTGPIVGTVLIKSTGGQFWEPIITMLAFSVAFALPFVLFALFPSMLSNLPKSGGWLNSVKVVLGFVEVALGLKFLSVADQTYHWGILDREVYLAIWIVVFAMLGFYLLGKIRFANDSEQKHVGVTRLFLAIGVFSFVVYLVPGMFGAPLKGIAGYLPPMHTQDFVVNANGETAENRVASDGDKIKYSDFLFLPHGLRGYFDYEQAIEYAKKVGKPLFVDFTGHGCVNCREMEARVWSQPEVLKILRDEYVILALYSDDKTVLPPSQWVTTDSGKILKGLGRINSYFAHRKFGANAQPYYLLLDNEGELLVTARGYNLDVQGYVEFLMAGVREYKNRVK